jgi:hypothetical protein
VQHWDLSLGHDRLRKENRIHHVNDAVAGKYVRMDDRRNWVSKSRGIGRTIFSLV